MGAERDGSTRMVGKPTPFPSVDTLPMSRFPARMPQRLRVSAFPRPILPALLMWMSMALLSAEAQSFTQEITLRPGWNSVYVEVEPGNPRTEGVFAGIPVESVWTRGEKLLPADFVQDQNEIHWNEPGWLVYVPATSPEGFLTTLHAIRANQAYLIKLGGDRTIAWRVSGRPSLRHPAWVPDAFNLRGFPIDPANPPRFAEHFRSSPAHFNTAAGTLEEVFRLGLDGRWTPVAPTDRMASGEAWWVYCRGASSFVAPLGIDVDQGDGLDYGALLDELNLRLRNRTPTVRTATVRPLSPTGAGLLAMREVSGTNGEVRWPTFGASRAHEVAPGAATRIRLAPRRSAFNQNELTEVLTVTDGLGTRHLIPLVARLREGTPGETLHPHAGLWLGALRVTAVAEAHGRTPGEPTPVRAPFQMRLMLHVDAAGQARLLKEVIQMWKDGTYRTEPDGTRVPDQQGRFVWLTRPELAVGFSGTILRDGVPVGRRISCAGMDFGGGTNATLGLSGRFVIGERLTGTIRIASDAPTNPFLHRFHPDHDNLDATFGRVESEAFEIVRNLEFELTAADPTGFSAPDYGRDVLGGVFRETIQGLHHRSLAVSGDFRLRRIADTPDLDPAPRAN
jgi:hypothetical protein